MTTIENFRTLERAVVSNQVNLEALLPEFWPNRSSVAQAICTRGTRANAMMKAICMVLADELTIAMRRPPE